MLFVEFNMEDALRVQKEEGKEEGKLEGKLEGIINVAKNLIGILDKQEIAKATGLPLEEIEELHNK